MRLPPPSTDDRPDNLFPWERLDIDEQAFGELETVRQDGPGSWWPFIIGGVIGFIILVVASF